MPEGLMTTSFKIVDGIFIQRPKDPMWPIPKNETWTYEPIILQPLQIKTTFPPLYKDMSNGSLRCQLNTKCLERFDF